MPYMLICQKDDGSVHVNAFPGEAAPEMLQDAAAVDSLEDAAGMVVEVLGGGAPAAEGAEQPMEGEQPAAEPAPEATSTEDAMQHGYDRARKGL